MIVYWTPKGASDDDDHTRGVREEHDTFNAHDIDGFAEVLADAHVEVTDVHIIDDVAV